MSITVVASTIGIGGFPGASTGSIDSTGADLIVLSLAYLGGFPGGVSDSLGNTWTPLTQYGPAQPEQLFYCAAPTVGVGHTFSTTAGFPVIYALAVSGSHPTPFDAENGADSSGMSLQPGSITPSSGGCLIVTGINFYTGDTATISAGFTADTESFGGGVNIAGGGAYEIQGGAVAVDPTWNWNNPGFCTAAIASFLPLTPPPAPTATSAILLMM